MQQVLNFKIELFDVRMRTSIKVINDTALVKSIQINKSITLDNIATIVFAKSKTYKLLDIEGILKLYNYVKIELTLKNYLPDSEEKFYFSGFIQTINKAANFGVNPSATVSIAIADYASLLKTTFYTKNLTFLEILNQAIPEFRLINLTEYLGSSSQKLLDDFYSPAQLGFIFFSFLYFKFMYKIVYDENGASKKTNAPESREIFKKFKIYLPFGFDIDIPNGDSFLKGQDQTITIYKQLQGVALDLFKYIYPEPIFEFTTYETEDSSILMIRFTPLMKFNRPVTPPKSVTIGEGKGTEDTGIIWYDEKTIQTEGYAFDPNSYNVIEKYDFGFNRIKSIREQIGVSPSQLLKEHLDATPKNLMTTLQDSIGQSKNMQIEDLVADDSESDEITSKFFNITYLDSDLIETLNMTRSASSVVNVIWTVATTDTAILKMSGREMVYAYLEQRMNEVGGLDKFGNYVSQQFNPGFNPNPAFLMDYKGAFKQDFISGDMNYFGFREFEVKWNYLSLHYNAVANILAFVDKDVLKQAREASKDKAVTRILDDAMRANSDIVTQSSSEKYGNPRRNKGKKAFPPFSSSANVFNTPYETSLPRQTSRAGNSPKPSKNKTVLLNKARNTELFKKALETYKDVFKEKDITSATKIIELLMKAKSSDDNMMGGFVAKLNSVIAEAYRENEHLYDCTILRPIVLSVLPGMIVESTSKSIKGQSPRIKGYVTTVSHSIDFNAASMKTTINVSRAASDDSGVIAAFNPGTI